MDASRITIDELLSPNKKCYVVPPYQRGYAWELEQVEELWNDLEAAYDSEHFLGSIVLQYYKTREPQIIDGQQRLATLMIFLACVRDHYAAIERPDSMATLHTNYIETHRPGHGGVFKLRLSDVDDMFFREYLLMRPDNPQKKSLARNKKPKAPSHRRLWLARNYLYEKIAEKLATEADAAAKAAALEVLEEQIVERIRVIQILVDDDDEAFQIFETLNDRGLSLSAADLLKNHLCLKRKTEKPDCKEITRIVDRWDTAMQPLSERTDISVFLRHYLLSIVDDDKVRKDKIYDILKKHIADKKAADAVDELAKHAGYYCIFLSPGLCEDKATRRTLANLVSLRATQCYSMLLAARDMVEDRDFSRLLKMSEILTVRHSTICNRSARDLERHYHDCALVLRNPSTKVQEVLDRLAKVVPDDNVVKASFDEMRHSRTTPFLLRRIEEFCAREERVLEPDQVHVEHVLPQSLPGDWLQYLGSTKDKAREYVDKLGNLTLLGAEYNQSASNKCFESKRREYYSKSTLTMTRKLLSQERWDFNTINLRQKELAELACRTWDPCKV